MASHSRKSAREDHRRLSVRTLVIASAASFTAAIVTAQFSTAGTPVAAALTPVLVTLVSELLHRPTEQIAQRITSDRPAVLPEGAGAGPPPTRREEELPARAPTEPGTQPQPGAAERAPMRVYGKPPGRRRKIAVGVVAVTALLAFAISAAALTLPELIAGESVGRDDRGTSIFGGKSKKKDDREEQPQSTTPTETVEQPQKTVTETVPEEQEEKKKQQTTPTETTPTTPAPQQQPQP
jgi:hypothetical protein